MQRRLDAVLTGVRGGPTYRVVGDASVTITDVTIDSREVVPGALFCCLPGAHHDGHEFAAASVAAGAAAILVERELPLAVPQVVTSAARALTGWVAAAFHDHPCDALQMVGVTGTNGKTTTSQLIGDVLRHAGRQVEVLGTLSGKHTTPEAPALQRQLAAWRDGGVDVVVMEVSSHALVMDRVAGTRFDVAVFTNLGRDHLDLHGTVERYFAAKARLFEATLSDLGIVNVDDVSDLRVEATWHEFTWRGVDVRVGIGGRYNASNSLAAAEACAALGLSPATIAAGLRAARPVPGRFEPVDAGQPFAVIVDYAHTPDGLAVALAAARDAAGGHRVLVVFGCGGDRDREKRPEMGSVAAAGADVVVVTSDNPRSEDPAAIIDAIIRGVPADYRGRVVIEADRSLAIATAIHHAQPGDVVLIAGKGHETTQTIGTTVLPFDDRAVARTLLEARS
jgi:UDP-N-acetylmuramoyl-L-alanyl-D-glutamate--2,6-diaminopimelate ligase